MRRTGVRRVGKKGEQNRREIDQARTAILFRSAGRCEARFSDLCTGYGAHAHHLVRRARGGANTPDNLVWICFPCHRKIHDNPAEALIAGWLRPGGDAA